MRMPGWFGAETAKNIAEGEIKQLTDQFHVTLRAYFARVPAADGKLAPGALQRLQELLQPDRPRSWIEAYEIEQLLVPLYDGETLQTELGVRGLEARTALRPPLADLYAGQITSTSSPERQRGLLARLVNDLRWRYTVNEVKRRYAQDITAERGGSSRSRSSSLPGGRPTSCSRMPLPATCICSSSPLWRRPGGRHSAC
jgi:hypothetical protein